MEATKPKDAEEEDPVTKALKEIYYNPEDSGSYGGVEKLYRSAKQNGVEKITRGRIKQFLSDQHSYSLHKPARRHLKRNRTYVKGSMPSGRRICRTCRL